MREAWDTFEVFGKKYYATWLPDFDYSKVSPLTQSYAFCFDKNNRLLVINSLRFDTWQIPGGTIEEGETPEETLAREMMEEADVTLKNVIYLGTQKVDDEDGKSVYQLRYAAKIDKIFPSTVDPDKGIVLNRKFIDPLTYGKVSKWGERGDEMTRLAMEKLGIKVKIK